jgi:hypothetical protein
MLESYNPTYKYVVWAIPRSLATTKGISIDFSTLATKMFQFAKYPPFKGHRTLLLWGCPIRKSPGQRLLTSRRSLSQLAASFIGIQSQGIHYML